MAPERRPSGLGRGIARVTIGLGAVLIPVVVVLLIGAVALLALALVNAGPLLAALNQFLTGIISIVGTWQGLTGGGGGE